MSKDRLIWVTTSRKLWGGILASTAIVLAGIYLPAAAAAIAIPALGTIWALAIGGQAVTDYKKSNNGSS